MMEIEERNKTDGKVKLDGFSSFFGWFPYEDFKRWDKT